MARTNCLASSVLVTAVVVSSLGVLLAAVPPARAVTFFFDSFDPFPQIGWMPSPNPDNAWHLATGGSPLEPCYGNPIANHPAAPNSGMNAYAYHYDRAPPAVLGRACTYDYGPAGPSQPNFGFLDSPPLDLTFSGPTVWLHFATWRQTEGNPANDVMQVNVNGLPAYTLLDPPVPQTVWETIDVNISTLAAGQNPVVIEFVFAALTALNNDFAGWYIDDVLVDDQEPASGGSDTMTVRMTSLAPITASPAQARVAMAAIDATVDANDVTLNAVTVSLTGNPPTDADIASVDLWADNGDGFFDPFFDTNIGGGVFSGGVAAIPLLPPQIISAGSPSLFFVTYDIDLFAGIGNYVGVGFTGLTDFAVSPPDSVQCANCPFSTYIPGPGARTLIVGGTPDTLTFTPSDMAPTQVPAGTAGVLMARVNLSVDANWANVTGINLTLTGSPPDPTDISNILVLLDDGNGLYDLFDVPVGFGGFTGLLANIPFLGLVPVFAGNDETLWITYDIAPTAVPGHFVGAALLNDSYVIVAPLDTAVCNGCPFDTYVLGTKTEIMGPTPDVLTIAPVDMAPPTAQQAQADTLIAALDASVDNNSATLETVAVGLSGFLQADADIAVVELWIDTGDGIFDPFSDFVRDAQVFLGGTAMLSAFWPVNFGFPERFFITYDISGTAGIGHRVGASLLGAGNFTVTAPDTVNCAGCPFDTHDGVKTLIVASTTDTLTVEPIDLAPATVQPGDFPVVMGRLNLSVDANTATLTDVTLRHTGLPPTDTDIAVVFLSLDDGDDVPEFPGDPPVGVGNYLAGSVTMPLTPATTVTAGTNQTLWVMYAISVAAVPGNYTGFLVGPGDFVVSVPDLVACTGCPMNTYDGLKTLIIPATVDTVTFTGLDLAPPTTVPGATDVLMAAVDMSVDANTALLGQLVVNLSGSPPLDQDIALAEIWIDDGDLAFNPAVDTVFDQQVFGGGILAFNLLYLLTAGSPVRWWITFDIDTSPPAVPGDLVGVRLFNDTSLFVLPPDLSVCGSCPFDTYDGSKTLIWSGVPADTLTVAPTSIAPNTTLRQDVGVLVLSLGLTVDANSAELASVRVDRTGTGTDADIAAVDLWQDDGDGIPNAADTLLDTGVFVAGTVTLAAGVTVTNPASQRLFVTYDIAAGAAVGAFFGGRIDTAADVPAVGPDGSACSGCPVDSYVAATRTQIVSLPPEPRSLTVENFAAATAGILHIIDPAPTFNWSYFETEGDLQADYEVRVSSTPGASGDIWTLGPAGTPGLTAVYAGPSLAVGATYYLAVNVSDAYRWSGWNETPFRMNTPPTIPAAPTVPTPGQVNVPAGASQTVTWSASTDNETDAVNYAWEVSTDPTFTPPVLASGSGIATTSGTFTTLSFTTFYWRVQATDGWEPALGWSATFNFTTGALNIPPAASFLYVAGYPAGSAGIGHILVASPLLNWTYSDTESQPQTEYEVRVGTAPGGNQMWAPGAAPGASLNAPYAGSALVDGTDYYFGVRVFDGLNWSAWAEVPFHTNAPPPAPALTLPANGTLVIPTAVTLAWASVTDLENDPVEYAWFLSVFPAFPPPPTTVSGTTSTTSAAATVAGPATYYWRVRAFDGYEDSGFDGWFTFTTGMATGNLTVHVEGSGGVDVVGATVLLIRNGSTVDSQPTTAGGVVTFAGLDPGSYTVQVTAEGYELRTVTATVIAGQTVPVEVSLSAKVVKSEFPWWILLLLLVLIVFLILFLFLRRRKKKEEAEEAAPASPVAATPPVPPESASADDIPQEFPPPPGAETAPPDAPKPR